MACISFKVTLAGKHKQVEKRIERDKRPVVSSQLERKTKSIPGSVLFHAVQTLLL